jgi:L-alanine-DL-glutamate epimerase-like enolase superfamily enzyme
MQSDIRILEVQPYFSLERAREPLKFGAVVLEEVLYVHVRVRAENRAGKIADGWGAIPLSDFWAFPSKLVAHPLREQAFRRLTSAFCQIAEGHREYGHPIALMHEMEKTLPELAKNISQELALAEPLPYLGALVCASPLDAALHDAFGVVNGIDSYAGYTAQWMDHDLSRYLGTTFKGRYPADYLRPTFRAEVPVFHLVGGLDILRRAEVPPTASRDGLPNCLEDWVRRDGLICLKVKLKGTDMAWDLNRTAEVVRIAREAREELGQGEAAKLHFSADTNEQCESPDYIVEYLTRLRERDRFAFDHLLYVEQPTERDLRAHRYDMRPIAALKPVIIDESLTSLEDFDLAMELGWSGIALKSCKGHSGALLYAAKATAAGIPYTIQDLTNPGISLIHSVGLAARLSPMMGVEANSPQFFPGTSEPEAAVHPDLFNRRDGLVRTHSLKGPGLGYRIKEIPRTIFH